MYKDIRSLDFCMAFFFFLFLQFAFGVLRWQHRPTPLATPLNVDWQDSLFLLHMMSHHSINFQLSHCLLEKLNIHEEMGLERMLRSSAAILVRSLLCSLRGYLHNYVNS